MHIVFAVSTFPKNAYEALSGMPGYVYKICKCLNRRGHFCEIVAGSKEDRKWKFKEIPVYEVYVPYDLNKSFTETNLAVVTRETAIQRCLKWIDEKEKIDVVQYAGWSGLGFLHGIKCPGILRLSTYAIVQYKNNELLKDVKLLSFWERRAGRRCDAVICPGRELAAAFEKDIKKKVSLMETPYYEEGEEDTSVAERFAGKRYVLFSGSTTRDKGFRVLVEMMPELLGRHRDLSFVVAGWNSVDGGVSAVDRMRNALGTFADRFFYLGVLPHSELRPVIRNAELVLIPSIIDNLPNTCLEAMFLDKIVIGTRHSTVDQMIVDGENGFLAEPSDADSLLSAIEKGLRLTSAEKESMIERGRILRAPYEEDKAVSKLISFYEEEIRRYW